jgi:EmrB/QacA subfamily drug resistance transporter
MEYKWKALSVTSVGALMSAVDGTVVLLALFPIAEDLHSDFVTMIWVIIAYLLVNTALVLSFGRLSDMFGRKLMYNIGFVIFTIGSALCGLAFSGDSLVAFRVVQGMGSSLLVANSFAILSEAFPRNETGRAFGVMSIVWGLGSVVGVILGGIIITFTSWRLIFLINVPIGIFATLWAYKTLRANKPTGKVGSFDIPAAVLFTAGLLSLLLGVTWGLLYSWTDYVTISALAGTPILFAVFVLWEAKFSKDPIVAFDFFRNRTFSFSIMGACLQFMAVFSVNFLLIFYLEGISGLTALQASYLIIPYALAAAAIGPIGGILSDRFGPRRISVAGSALLAVVLYLFSRLSVSTTLLEIGVLETFAGVGLGLFWTSNTSAIMSSTPPAKYGVGSGIMNTFRNTGMILSFAISLTAATSVIPPKVVYSLFIGNVSGKLSPALATSYLTGEGFAFEISTALLVVALIFCLLTPSRPRAKVPVDASAPAQQSSSQH